MTRRKGGAMSRRRRSIGLPLALGLATLAAVPRAGADQVVSPYAIGGHRMAQAALRRRAPRTTGNRTGAWAQQYVALL